VKKILIFLIIISIGLVAYFGYYKGSGQTGIDGQLNEEEMLAKNIELDASPDAVFAEPVTFSSLNKEYTHQGFSFKYPDGFNVFSAQIGGGELITVENKKGSGFQIFIIPFDEKGPITPERIWKDEPDAEVTDPKNAELDGVKTLAFYGYNGDIGDTFEVWPIYKGRLYQIMGPKTAEKLIIETLETWRWQR